MSVPLVELLLCHIFRPRVTKVQESKTEAEVEAKLKIELGPFNSSNSYNTIDAEG